VTYDFDTGKFMLGGNALDDDALSVLARSAEAARLGGVGVASAKMAIAPSALLSESDAKMVEDKSADDGR
jgi:hypothetical protein